MMTMVMQVVQTPMRVFMVLFFLQIQLSLDRSKIRKCHAGFQFVVNVFKGKRLRAMLYI